MAASIFLADSTQIPANTTTLAPAIQFIRYVASPDGVTFYSYSTSTLPATDAQTYLTANITALVVSAVALGKTLAVVVNGLAVASTQITTLFGTNVNPYIWDKLLILCTGFTTITAPPTITVGTTSGGAQILAATSLANFGSLKSWYIPLGVSAPFATITTAAGTPIWVNVTVAATGTGTPVFNFTVTPVGRNALDF